MSGRTKRTPGKQPERTSDSESVERYLSALKHPLKQEAEALRKIILKADPHVTEGIKWNVPSFHHEDWFATFDLRSSKWVQIIFHRGAKVKTTLDGRYVKDPEGILNWITNDRCAARFVSEDDVKLKAPALTRIVTEWVRNLGREAERV